MYVGSRRKLLKASQPANPPAGELEHLEPGGLEEPSWARFAETTNRSLLWAGVVAGSGGLLLVSLMSGRTLRPVRALTSAARRMGAGDLSQRVHASGRDEIGELAHTFNSMADDLERAERQRRNLVADVAHELRTPLSNVQGYVEALRDGVLEPDVQTLATIHQQVLYLSELVEDLRLLADTEAGDISLHREPGSLAEALRASVEGVRARADAKGVAVASRLPASAPDVTFDRTRIAQVVGNLLDNAIRHTPAGGSVTVEMDVGAAFATVSIRDNGEGISAETLPFVFDRLYRVDPLPQPRHGRRRAGVDHRQEAGRSARRLDSRRKRRRRGRNLRVRAAAIPLTAPSYRNRRGGFQTRPRAHGGTVPSPRRVKVRACPVLDTGMGVKQSSLP